MDQTRTPRKYISVNIRGVLVIDTNNTELFEDMFQFGE